MTRRRRLLVTAAALAVAIALTTAVLVHTDLGTADSTWSVISGAIALASLVTGMLVPSFEAPANDARVSEVDAALVADFGRQLREEERLQRLHDPWPIPVRVAPAGKKISDHWPVIRGRAGQDTAARLVGEITDIGQLFAAIPSGRLVLIGPAGAGKTVAARRLAVVRADAWRPGDPVPVLLSLASWDRRSGRGSPSWLQESRAARFAPCAAAVGHAGRC